MEKGGHGACGDKKLGERNDKKGNKTLWVQLGGKGRLKGQTTNWAGPDRGVTKQSPLPTRQGGAGNVGLNSILLNEGRGKDLGED